MLFKLDTTKITPYKTGVINEITLSKEIRIKNNNQDWFDGEVVDLIHVRKKIVFKV